MLKNIPPPEKTLYTVNAIERLLTISNAANQRLIAEDLAFNIREVAEGRLSELEFLSQLISMVNTVENERTARNEIR
ncbi:hypothetical protein [Aliikangiella coralliicola]|uniref:Uncharacterized protein n=1 Tax=Aliikangiella coralliicola TaxID=2592383 RepID=A0A545TV12_9GAMM|nr:hypothetical protein [Aliikangiella coralliicola]TQV81063.1 hypothetical protein FLL46_25975 [Aliikangiella coralliicola]